MEHGTRQEEDKVGLIKPGPFGVERKTDRITVDEDHECIA